MGPEAHQADPCPWGLGVGMPWILGQVHISRDLCSPLFGKCSCWPGAQGWAEEQALAWEVGACVPDVVLSLLSPASVEYLLCVEQLSYVVSRYISTEQPCQAKVSYPL